jgi:hypothetical protein
MKAPEGTRTAYRILASLPFDNERKRSSIVVERPDGAIWLYTKGADSSMYEIADANAAAGGAEEAKGASAKSNDQITFHSNALEGGATPVNGTSRWHESMPVHPALTGWIHCTNRMDPSCTNRMDPLH